MCKIAAGRLCLNSLKTYGGGSNCKIKVYILPSARGVSITVTTCLYRSNKHEGEPRTTFRFIKQLFSISCNIFKYGFLTHYLHKDKSILHWKSKYYNTTVMAFGIAESYGLVMLNCSFLALSLSPRVTV